jgi:hypothetical protein
MAQEEHAAPAVLLIIFNRPEHTQRALQAMGAVRPKTVLVAADGPRNPEETAVCAATRDVIRGIDWDCTVLTNYSGTNLGCGIRVYTAIDWALTLFEEVIVLEDDCIPEPAFFHFCEELLEYYRTDERVMHISGNNFQPVQSSSYASYYFSKYTHAWGWATWRRAWKHFDWALTPWPELRKAGMLRNWCDDPYEQRFWTDIFDRMCLGAPDVWDYQWNCACWAQNGLAILPAVNLVSNHGYGPEATHTKELGPHMNRPTGTIGLIRHPDVMVRDYEADAYTFAHNYGGAGMKAADSRRARLRRRFRMLLWPAREVRKLVQGLVRLTNRHRT